MSQQSKIVCITGASSGIGLATAEEFAKQGYKLVLGARRLGRLKELEPKLKSLGATAVLSLMLDVTDGDCVDQFVTQLDSKLGCPDVLVNNAGLVLGADHLAAGNIDEWQTIFDTNVLGVLRVCRQLLPRMTAKGQGHIIFTGSISGHQVYAGGGPYCASKHGIKALSQTLKLELNGTGIRVSSIDPGMVETEFSVVRLGSKDLADKVYQGMTPLTAKDVAECIYFAASRPTHVNIDNLIVMPSDQATVYQVHRQ